MLLRFFAPVIANGLGLYIAIKYIPGVTFTGGYGMLIAAAVVLGLLHFFVKPILKVLAFPLILLTAGIFSFVINLGLLEAADRLVPQLTIDGIVPLVLTTMLLSIIHFII